MQKKRFLWWQVFFLVLLFTSTKVFFFGQNPGFFAKVCSTFAPWIKYNYIHMASKVSQSCHRPKNTDATCKNQSYSWKSIWFFRIFGNFHILFVNGIVIAENHNNVFAFSLHIGFCDWIFSFLFYFFTFGSTDRMLFFQYFLSSW